MTPFLNFSSPSQDLGMPAGMPSMTASADEAQTVPVDGEVPAGFADVLELCAEPAPPPLLTGQPAVVPSARRMPAQPATSEETGVEVEPRPLATTARSLRLDTPLAQLEENAPEDVNPAIFSAGTEETEDSSDVSEEALCRGVIMPLSMPAPQPMAPVAETFTPATAGTLPEKNVVDKKLQGSPVPLNPPGTLPETGTALSAAQSEVAMPLLPRSVAPEVAEATGLPVPSVDTENTPVLSRRMLPAAEVKQVEVMPNIAPEKIAATETPRLDRSVIPISGSVKNKFLKTDNQGDALIKKQHGIVNAKPSVDMKTHAEPSELPAAPLFTRAAVTVPVAATESGVVPVMNAPVPVSATTPDAATRRDVFMPVADATAVVREVAELTHDFRMRERSSVEVKFNFKDEPDLTVRLAYRDGDVHTTFRTDSDELRAALGREWHGYAAAMAPELRTYRIVDPVFTASNSTTDFTQGRDAGSSAGGDAGQRQSASHPEQAGLPRSASPSGEFRPHTPALGHRVSSDRLLHAFA
jgi:hypothetical protein